MTADAFSLVPSTATKLNSAEPRHAHLAIIIASASAKFALPTCPTIGARIPENKAPAFPNRGSLALSSQRQAQRHVGSLKVLR